MDKEKDHEAEWLEAQKIKISVDLFSAAKQQLQFLATVDKNRWLYEGPALEKAIYRYNACWLPLLAKNSESSVSEEPLVPPLDCEWIWHCHRLNPVRYKSDCEEFYGTLLDNSGVVSSVNGNCKSKTEAFWKTLYPEEPYDLDLNKVDSEEISKKSSTLEKCTKYDLVSAVKRQSPFYYQVSRAHVDSDIFLQEAVARYMGFLYLIKKNRERSLNRFCVPTYDVDLIWHTHQLHPVSYCDDMKKLLGKALQHDDTDSDRGKGKELDNSFSMTTAQWEETFGTRYWKAGVIYRGKTKARAKTKANGCGDGYSGECGNMVKAANGSFCIAEVGVGEFGDKVKAANASFCIAEVGVGEFEDMVKAANASFCIAEVGVGEFEDMVKAANASFCIAEVGVGEFGDMVKAANASFCIAVVGVGNG